MNRQDRQGVRTAPDLEQKYNFKKNFSDVMETARAAGNKAVSAQQSADAAKKAAEEAKSEILKLSDSITLTVTNGLPGSTAQIVLKVGDKEYSGEINLKGLVTIEDLATEGKTVINGGNITTGEIIAELVKTGLIGSGGKGRLDLTNGVLALYDNTGKQVVKICGTGAGGQIMLSQDGSFNGGIVYEVYAESNEDNAWLGIGTEGLLAYMQTETPDPSDPSKCYGVMSATEFRAWCLANYGEEVVMGRTKDRGYVTGLTAPVDASDAVNKEYVDKGFAPASLAYKECYIASGTEADVLTAINSVYAGMPNNSVRYIVMSFGTGHPVLGGAAYLVKIYRRIGTYGALEMFSYDSGHSSPIRRNLVNGTWSEYEWENPVMTTGVEYRTTERYAGSPVYIKLVDCGAMPSVNEQKVVEHGCENVSEIVDFGGNMKGGGGAATIALPYRFSSTNYAHLSVTYNKIYIETGGTALTAYTKTKVWLKYTKTT